VVRTDRGDGVTLSDLVSPFVGVVRSLDEVLAGTADAQLPVYTCDTVDDPRLLGGPLAVGGVCGIGLDRDTAVAAALGETAERYSLTLVPGDRIVRRAATDVAGAVDPLRFGLFTPEQYGRDGFPFVPFDDRIVVPWIDGWDVRTDELAWLPAELVLLGDPVEPGAHRVAYATSSGAACASTIDEAVAKGLFELLERDAFMLVWSRRLSLPLLDWSDVPEMVALDERVFRPSGLSYSAVDLSWFHDVPSVLAVVRSRAGAAVGVGAGTATTIERAWWKALSEAFACRSAATRLSLLGKGRDLRDDGADVIGFDDHIVFYADEHRAGRTAFLDASAERVDARAIPPLAREPSELVEQLCDRIEAAGSSAYAVDVTAPDVAELGVRVVKTVAPELCMLDVPHGARFLGNPRLRIAAAATGFVPAPDLNPDPHPFP
jgi:ribosomal protein S12 methylthiotransferase accessory factor